MAKNYVSYGAVNHALAFADAVFIEYLRLLLLVEEGGGWIHLKSWAQNVGFLRTDAMVLGFYFLCQAISFITFLINKSVQRASKCKAES